MTRFCAQSAQPTKIVPKERFAMKAIAVSLILNKILLSKLTPKIKL